MKALKKSLTMFLVFTTLCSLCFSITSAAGSNLITASSNPAYGYFSITVSIPPLDRLMVTANKTGGSISQYSGYSEYNPNTTWMTRTMILPVGKLVGSYTVHVRSSRTAYISSSVVIINRFYSMLTSDKFTWTQEAINNYNKGNAVGKVFQFGFGVMLDALLTKGLSTTLNAVITMNEVLPTTPSTKNIQNQPLLNYSYVIYKVPNSSGYTTYLYVYNPSNVLTEIHNLGTKTWSTI
ncbi:hypothetical protein IZU99_07095 [Oscillospiraceae bacterium CM]|nr:hypothetical protein IZU99_07095 [Oscillospiraceae bacterium CM]